MFIPVAVCDANYRWTKENSTQQRNRCFDTGSVGNSALGRHCGVRYVTGIGHPAFDRVCNMCLEIRNNQCIDIAVHHKLGSGKRLKIVD